MRISSGRLDGVPQARNRLDDPGQHQIAEHLITASRPAEVQHVIGTRQSIEQAAHSRRGDRQRPASRTGIQTQVKLTLTGRQAQGFVKVGVAVRDSWGGLTRPSGGIPGVPGQPYSLL